MGSGDVGFLNTRVGGSGIGTVVILASKFDSVLQDIGADREMKHEERGDLADTAEMQTKKFKSRLREISDTIDESLRSRLKMDTTAGIGNSIAHKPSNKWDEAERNAVAQMKRFYPDYFATEADVKETFEGLANIDEIRQKYLDDVFRKNKDAIIAEKVNGFFDKNRAKIADGVQRILADYENRRELLNASTIEEIRNQKLTQQRLFDGLKNEFKLFFTQFSSNLQKEVKSTSNRLEFNAIRSIPEEETTSSITCKGRFWGHNNHSWSTMQVNTHALEKAFCASVDTYVSSWNAEWKKLFENARKELVEKLTAKISDFDKEVMSTSFNDVYYRNLIDSAIEELKGFGELDVRDLIDTVKAQGGDIASEQYYPSDTYDLEENEVDPHLRRQFDEHKKKLIGEFRTLAESLKEDVRKKVNKSLSGAVEVIDGMKTSFAENLQKEGAEYLNSLEKDMEAKTEVLHKMEQITNCLKELSALYK